MNNCFPFVGYACCGTFAPTRVSMPGFPRAGGTEVCTIVSQPLEHCKIPSSDHTLLAAAASQTHLPNEALCPMKHSTRTGRCSSERQSLRHLPLLREFCCWCVQYAFRMQAIGGMRKLVHCTMLPQSTTYSLRWDETNERCQSAPSSFICLVSP